MNRNTIRKVIDYIKRQKDQYPLQERIARSWFLLRNKPHFEAKTDTEHSLEIQLRENISRLPVEMPERKSSAENKWIRFKNEIRKDALSKDARTFLQWPAVLHNMHYTPSVQELNFIKKQKNWPEFKEALESKSSVFTPFFALPTANENAVRQAFHFEKFLSATSTNINEIEQIFEFGGGYGSMCVLLNRLGFKGTYTIFDWPELSSLQKYYISLEGVDISRIHFVNEVKDISSVLTKNKKTLIIGMWSLSECSPELRGSIMQAVNPDLFLISYQKKFGGVDNHEYFAGLQQSRNDVAWKTESIEYIPSEQNKYLFGVKK